MLLALRVVYPAFVDSLEEGGKHGVFRTVSDHLWKIWTEVVAANKNKTLKWTSVGVPGFNDMHELKNAVKSMDPPNDVLLSYITTYVGVLEFYSTEALQMGSKIQSMSGSTLESELVEFNSMMNRQVTNNLCNRTHEEQVKTKLAGSGIIEDTDSQQEKPSTPHKQAKGKRPTGRQQLYRSPKKKKTASDDVQGPPPPSVATWQSLKLPLVRISIAVCCAQPFRPKVIWTWMVSPRLHRRKSWA